MVFILVLQWHDFSGCFLWSPLYSMLTCYACAGPWDMAMDAWSIRCSCCHSVLSHALSARVSTMAFYEGKITFYHSIFL